MVLVGWEISQEFVDRWGWLVDEETIRTSNFWRIERGEAPLMVRRREVQEIPGGLEDALPVTVSCPFSK